MPLPIIERSSPNCNVRPSGAAVQQVVLHYTGMKTGAAALARLTDPASAVSAHYVIEENGQIFALVPEHLRAWHAGVSSWRGQENLNDTSIGIELVNPGHEFGYRPFKAAQLASLKSLLADIFARHALPPAALLAHSDIAPTRKQDPGELFPWQEFAAAGFGLWPRPNAADAAPMSMPELRQQLAEIGFAVPQATPDFAGDYDLTLRAVLLAFQRHWHPSSVSGNPELATLARVRAMARAHSPASRQAAAGA